MKAWVLALGLAACSGPAKQPGKTYPTTPVEVIPPPAPPASQRPPAPAPPAPAPAPAPAPIPAPVPAPKPVPPAAAGKKGLGMWSFPGAKAHEVKATWFYNWGPYPRDRGDAEFIPMIWGERDNNDHAYNWVKDTGGAALLGFNEPDHCDQACMSVERAIEIWPKLMATGLRLSSPAVAGDYGWQDRFMAAAKEKGYRVDFIAVHTYPDMTDPYAAADKVVELVTWVHERYGRPVWLTEFGAHGTTDWTAQHFIRDLLPRLDALPFVERYAWFSDHQADAYAPVFNNDGSLTGVGRAYAEPR